MKSQPISAHSLANTRTRSSIGLGLSVLLHALLLLFAIEHRPAPVAEAGDSRYAPLSVHLLPPSDVSQDKSSPPVAATHARSKKSGHPNETAKKEQPVAQKKVSPPRPDRLALKNLPTAPPQATAAPTDMMDMLTAARDRRRAAGVPDRNDTDSEQKPEDDNTIARANVEFSRQAHSRGRNDGGGVFQVTFKGVRTAELIFRGWDVRRRNTTRQLLEVDAGLHGDIDTAIVRKMIDLIRQYQSGDFNWESRRLGRVVVLSARPQDNAELEDFLKKDFFIAYR